MPQLIVDKLAIAYADEGKGPVVLMLHGWGSSVQPFDALARALAGKYRVVRLDLPGFGGSQLPDRVWGIPEYAALITDFCTKLAIRPTTLLGHSMGGQAAIYLVGQGLIRPQRLILIGASGVRDAWTVRQRLTFILAKAGKVVTRPFPAVANRLRTRLYATNGNSEYAAASPALAANYRRVLTEDQRANASRVHIPTLLIWGQQDADAPLRNAHILHRLIAHSRLEVLPGAGHFVFLDKPTETAILVEEFMHEQA